MDIHNTHVATKFDELKAKIDKNTHEILELNPNMLTKGDTGIVKFIPSRFMCVERFADFSGLGRFCLRDMRSVVAVGVILKVYT